MDHPIATRWWQRPRRSTWIGLTALLGLVVAATAILHEAGDRSLSVAAGSVTVATARRALFRDVVAIHGTLQPKEVVYVDAVSGGQVARILAQPGDRVTAGQPLIVFRNAQLVRDVLDNAGRLVESVTQVQSFETQLENNRASNDKTLTDLAATVATIEEKAARIDPLAARGFYPRGDADAVHIDLARYRRLHAVQQATNQRQEALRREQLPRLRGEQESLSRSLDATHAQLEDLVVRAPVTGTLTQLDLKLGQNRNRGDRLAEINSDAGFRILADIDEFYLPRVRVGQNVDLTFDGHSLGGRVIRVRPEVKNGAFTVEIDFIGLQPAGATPGAAIEGDLTLGADRPALVLPSTAVAQGSSDLFLLSPDGRSARRSPVRFGRRNPRQVEIRAGLAAGQRAIVSDTSAWSRIDRINVEE
ncbi:MULTISPECIES: efflux RND transporter periplasmic adaptor subunit [unclassified Sphingomonas]|uniref:efflux RND transporter periplasmic adaptor subunit n=1 Tax=unclassified Sphingomonas TaxID=196159 RepID=UPI00226AABF3|nr:MULTISPECIES: efflux RND transporter periplasmic adaptor subunit [unclassified Sphingomonas]